jgi:DNA-binding LacI/PurR family transcriptional regulator
MLLQMIEGGRVRSQIVQTLPELVLRASTGPPPSP